MKKAIIVLVVVISIIALLPIIGNNVAEEVLQERVSLLTANGLELKNDTTVSSYLSTKKHYEFLISDAPVFMEYLKQQSSSQIPPYVDAMISGAVVGLDIKYSNFPLTSKVVVDIYPLTLPTNISDELKKENIAFYTYVNKLLQGKGVLYHMNYYLSDKLFDGYIKDIDEEYLFDDGSKVNLKLSNATYYGNGSLIAPENLHTNISKISIKADKSKKAIVFEMNNLTSTSTFESQSTYVSGAAMKSMSFIVDEGQHSKLKASIDDIKINVSSNTQGKKAEFYTKSSFRKFKLNYKDADIGVTGFNYDISLDNVDKDSFEEFRKLSTKANINYSSGYEKQLIDSAIKAVSKGLSLSIADMSVKKITLKDKKPIDGFSLMAKIVLKEDPELAYKIKTSPMSISENINLSSTIKFSKDIYALINKEAPVTSMANSLAKENKNDLVFEITLNNGKLSVNDKQLN